MEAVTLPKKKHETPQEDDLFVSLVKGLEDIKAGRIKPWKDSS